MRLTEKYKDQYDLVGNGDDNVEVFSNNCENILNKLGKLEDLMEKYGIETIDELEEIIKSHNALALTFGGRVFKRKGE